MLCLAAHIFYFKPAVLRERERKRERESVCVCVCDGKYISGTQNVKRKRKKLEFIKFKNGKEENLKRKISASRFMKQVPCA